MGKLAMIPSSEKRLPPLREATSEIANITACAVATRSGIQTPARSIRGRPHASESSPAYPANSSSQPISTTAKAMVNKSSLVICPFPYFLDQIVGREPLAEA